MMHTEASYRAEWATLTGKSPSEIYVPEALRDGFTETKESDYRQLRESERDALLAKVSKGVQR